MNIMKKIARVTASGKVKSDPTGATWKEVTFLDFETGKEVVKIMTPKKASKFIREWRKFYPLGGKYIKLSERTNKMHLCEI